MKQTAELSGYFSLAKNKDGGRRPPRMEDNIAKINFRILE